MQPESRTRVVTFRAAEANCLRVGDRRFFLLRDGNGPGLLVDSQCSHRGGPLHLGQLDAREDQVVCPMHRLATPLATLRRRALPMIVRGDELLVVLPPGPARVRLSKSQSNLAPPA